MVSQRLLKLLQHLGLFLELDSLNMAAIQQLLLSYVSTSYSATGGTITTSGSYTIHTFNSTDNLVITGTIPSVDYLIIG